MAARVPGQPLSRSGVRSFAARDVPCERFSGRCSRQIGAGGQLIRWESRFVGFTAHRCRRMPPRSRIWWTTAAIRAQCSVSCAAGGQALPRDVDLPIEGPVTRVIHSADGHWLACQVAPEGGTRSQIWVVTTDPDDRDARRIDSWPPGAQDGTAELISWDGTQVAAILTGEDGVGSSCLIDPADGRTIVLDRRSSGRLVDAWAGAALVRVGPRGYRDLIMLRGRTEIALLPYDPGSTTDTGIILDDHGPRRLRAGPGRGPHRAVPTGEKLRADSTEGYVRALIRSENGAEHARLLEVTTTAEGVSYQVVAERPGYELDEFTVSDDLSTVALLWNIHGASELQILELADYTLHEPIPLPGMVASELSISAGGTMLAMTVEGPSTPPTVELVDPRSREWEPVDREPSLGPVTADPTLETITARDGLEFTGWLFRPRDRESIRSARWCSCMAGPRARVGRATTSSSRRCSRRASRCSCPTCGAPGDSVAHSCTPTTRSSDSQPSTMSRMPWLSRRQRSRARRPHRMLRLVLRRLSDPGGAHLSSAPVRRRHQYLRDERPEHVVSQHRTVDRCGRLREVRPPGQRPRVARRSCRRCNG